MKAALLLVEARGQVSGARDQGKTKNQTNVNRRICP